MNVFYTNPRLSALLFLFVLLLGGTALMGLARQEDPTMTERWAGVSTYLPGATAARIESLVTEPVETKLREIPEIRTIDSNSRAGYSIVGIELYDSVSAEQTDVVWSEIRDKLTEAHALLPPGTSVPLLEKRAPLASTLIVALEWTQDGPIEMGVISRLAESLKIKLANLPGTKETEIYGESEEEILVTADPYKLAASGLTTGVVARAIAAADTKASAGRLRSGASDLLVEVEAELDSPERIARIPLKEDPNGGTLRVSDVAEVTKYQVDPPATMAFHGDRRAVLIKAKMEPNLRIDAWIAQAKAALDRFAEQLPQGVGMEIVYNQNDYTSARMQTLTQNLVWALVIVMLLLVWFMGVRSALTVGITLPLSAAMVLGAMHLMDIPLHQMSVTGLIISLGLLIDNAIVVIESYKLNRAGGADIANAIDRSLKHLLVPLGASTATTVFAFMTIAMAPGGVGDFTGTIGVSVVLAVTSSYLLAMTIVPAIAGFAERRWPLTGGRRWWHDGYSNEALTERYRASVRRVLAKPWLGVGVGVLLPAMGFLLAPTLTQQFFPPVDRNQFQIQLSLPAHSSIWETRAAVAQAQGILKGYPEITDTHWTLGEGAPRTFYNVLSLNDGVASFAAAWVDTVSAEATQAILPGLQRELMSALPNAQVLALPFEQGPPFEAPIEIRVVGPDLGGLRALSDQLRLLLAESGAVTYTKSTISSAEPKLVFSPNENPTAATGLSTGDLPRQLSSALLGSSAGTVQEGNTELGVRVRIDNSRRDEVHEVASMPMVGVRGGTVPLDQLGRWTLEPAASGIQRFQGERISTVQAYLMPYVLPASVMTQFRERLAASDLVIPAGFRLDIGGEEEERSESVGNLLSVFVMFVAAMAAVVILSLNSFRQAALIGLVGALSFGLALFGVRLFGYPMGFTALIGALGMVGLAINGAIIVLSALRANPRVRAGDSEAAADVVVDATRHIVSTTATTIGGFLPLILFGGTFWPPLATAIAGGVGGAAIIALYMVPAVYMAIVRRQAGAASRAEAPSGPAAQVLDIQGERLAS